MLNLRTNEGLDLNQFKKEFGVSLLDTKRKEIDEMKTKGYLYERFNCLKPTYQGMMILDTIILKLI